MMARGDKLQQARSNQIRPHPRRAAQQANSGGVAALYHASARQFHKGDGMPFVCLAMVGLLKVEFGFEELYPLAQRFQLFGLEFQRRSEQSVSVGGWLSPRTSSLGRAVPSR